MYQVVASDLDGTLLNGEHQLDPRTVDTVRRIAGRGVNIVLATGRHAVDVAGIRDVLGVRPYLISSNGARVHAPDGTVIHARDVPAEMVRVLTRSDIAGAHGRVSVSLFTEHSWLIDRELPYLLDAHQDSGFAYQCTDLRAHDGQGVAKVLYTGTPEDLAAVEKRLLQQFGDTLYITYTQADFLEAMAPDVSKGRALRIVLERLGAAPEHCIAFGDNLNDIDMLELVGRPYLMANAHPDLFEQLPQVPRIGRNDEGAVARQLDQLFADDAH